VRHLQTLQELGFLSNALDRFGSDERFVVLDLNNSVLLDHPSAPFPAARRVLKLFGPTAVPYLHETADERG
jgi:hypothetical protein